MESNKIIRKQIQKILSEDFGQGKDFFIDNIKQVNIYDLLNPEDSIDTVTGAIKFTIELELRKWGIEGAIINVQDFVVQRVINDNLDETRHETIAYIKNGIPQDDFKVTIQKTSGKGHIGVYEANISELKKEIEISFYSI